MHPRHVPRAFNGYADWESNVAMDQAEAELPPRVVQGERPAVAKLIKQITRVTELLKALRGNQDVFLGRDTMVNTLTALGDPAYAARGISRRPKFMSPGDTQRVLRELHDHALRAPPQAAAARRAWGQGFEPSHFYPIDRDNIKRKWLQSGRGEPVAPK